MKCAGIRLIHRNLKVRDAAACMSSDHSGEELIETFLYIQEALYRFLSLNFNLFLGC